MNVFRLKPSTCPTCKRKLDAADYADDSEGRGPQPGDFTICFRCGEELRFTEDMGLKKASFEEISRAVLKGELDPEQLNQSRRLVARARFLMGGSRSGEA